MSKRAKGVDDEGFFRLLYEFFMQCTRRYSIML